MEIGIVGLGLIGGSLAKAFCREEGNTVLGWDTDSTIVEFAQIAQAIHGPLTDERLGELDLLLLATYPEAVVEHMTRLAPLLSKHTMVIDCAGTKEKVCAGVFPLAERYGFRFLGGHPMAGTHFSGFKYSRADLFDGAPMVIVPPRFDDIRLLDEAKKLGIENESVDVDEPVVNREMLGAEVILYFDEQGKTLAVRLSPENQTQVGEKVSLYFDMEKAHVFDPETEENIFVS